MSANNWAYKPLKLTDYNSDVKELS